MGWDSSFGIATCYRLDGPEVGDEIFRTCRDRSWGQHNLMYNGYWVFFPELKGPGLVLPTHPHLAPRLKKK